MEHLFDLGHRYISLLSPPPRDTTAVEERIEGFVQAHAARGIAFDKEIWISDVTATLPNAFHESNIEREIQRIVRLAGSPGNYCFLRSNITLLCWPRSRQSALVCGYRRIYPSYALTVRLNIGEGYLFTHMRQNEEEMGRLAIETVLGIMNHDDVAVEKRLPAELVVGASTGPVKSQ